MDEDKRKRLEILKMKNQNLKNELNKIGSTDYASSANIAPSVSMLKKESIKPAEMNLDDIKKSAGLIKNVMQKYRTDQLSTFNLSETFLGLITESYEEGVQCEIEREQKNDSDEEEKQKINSQKSFRKSKILTKGKTITGLWQPKVIESANEDSFAEEKDDAKPYVKVLSEEARRQIMNSSELNEFLSNRSRFMERVTFILLILRLLEKKKFTICSKHIMMRKTT